MRREISELERREFLEACSADFARPRANPQLWQEELGERRAWDCTLMDDLHDDFYPWDADEISSSATFVKLSS